MNKPTAVFLGNDTIYSVYNSEVINQLKHLFEIETTFIKKEDIALKKELLSKAEYAFSTWGMFPLSEQEIKEYLPNLKALFYAAGTVQTFARSFLNCGVKIFSAWAANAIPVAEFTVAQIILANKGVFQGLRRQEKGGRHAFGDYAGTFPGNYKTKIGILGAGMIGKLVIKKLKENDLDLYVFDPFVSHEYLSENKVKRADLSTIFSECQTISNHIANLPETVGIFNYELFSKMKKNATFINTGRGAQVVEDDLIKALEEEPSRTALLDVTYPEPPSEDSTLYKLQNVFLTPHIAGSLFNETQRMGEYMLNEATKLISRQETLYEITLEMLKTMA